MLYIKFENGKPVAVSDDHQQGTEWQARWDWHKLGFDHVQAIADQLNTLGHDGHYLATDNGPHCAPQFDVVLAPAVGDLVSYSFNGDTYPDGKVSKVSKDYRIITTDTGSRYYRRKLTGAWVKTGGTWSLVRGHHNERNPHF